MTISVACPTCAAVFQTPEQMEGKNVQCPKCGEQLLIPFAADPNTNWMEDATAGEGDAPFFLVADEPATTIQTPPTPLRSDSFAANENHSRPDIVASILIQCPLCGVAVNVPDAIAGKQGHCPACGQIILIPSANSAIRKATRFLSLPCVVLIFVFGFLPWSQVRDGAEDAYWRLTQSGLQTLYGGVSSSSNAMESERKEALAEPEVNRDQFAKLLQARRSDFFSSFSPFAVTFWTAALALLLIVLLAPLSSIRLRYTGSLAAVMVMMLVVQVVFGTPLERGANEAVYEVMQKDSARAIKDSATVTEGESVWFWLEFAAVLLVAGTELLTNLLWKSSSASPSHIGAASVLVLAALVAAAGVGVQMFMWHVGVQRMEAQLAELDRPEQERIARAKAAEEKQQQEQKRQQAELEQQKERDRLEAEKADQAARRQVEQQRLEDEEKSRELELEREKQRLESERLKIAAEKERQRMEEKAREALEARLAEKKLKDEKEAAAIAFLKMKEATRKNDLESRGMPYYPLPTTLYQDKNAKEWFEYLKEPKSITADGVAALVALKEEGMPFLLDLLENATFEKHHSLYLRNIKPAYVHRYDLPKLIPCLDTKYSISARMLALKDLSERAESAVHFAAIKAKLSDLQADPRYGKDVNALLEEINPAK